MQLPFFYQCQPIKYRKEEKKMEKLMKEKILKIAELCLDINSIEKNTLFFNYSGHVETLSVDYYKSGWKPNTYGDVRFRIPVEADYLTQDGKLEKLNEIIAFLEDVEYKIERGKKKWN